jgi:hypothetical protein
MQDVASREGNDVDAAIICLPTLKQTKFSPGKTNGWRPKQCLQRSEVRSEERTHCRSDESGPRFRKPPEPTSRNPLPKPRSSQSMERQQATFGGDDGKLLQERRPRATTTTRRGKELTSIPTPHDRRIQQHWKTTKGVYRSNRGNMRCRQPGHQGEDETHPPIPPAKKTTGESMEPHVIDKSRRDDQLRHHQARQQ